MTRAKKKIRKPRDLKNYKGLLGWLTGSLDYPIVIGNNVQLELWDSKKLHRWLTSAIKYLESKR